RSPSRRVNRSINSCSTCSDIGFPLISAPCLSECIKCIAFQVTRSWRDSLRPVLLPQLIQEAFTVGSDVPRVGPKTQVDAPPVVRHSGMRQFRKQFIEIQLAGAKRIVRAGVVLVQSAI